MNSSLLGAMFCMFMIVIAATVTLVIVLRKPKQGTSKDKGVGAIADKPASNQWKSWLLPVGVAFIIAIWTMLGALFFLAVVWVLRLNPGNDVSSTLGRNDQKTARRIYTWLFFSSFFTVPIFLIGAVDTPYTNNGRVLTALVPLILHVPLLLGLTSKSRFVYRHTQQGILLIALRAGLASIAVLIADDYTDLALLIFFLGNGGMWLFSSLSGWGQVSAGKCWFMERKAESLTSSAIPDQLPAQKHIEQSKDFIQRYKSQEAKQHALAAFRSGGREIKLQAIQILEVLDEVEKF